LIDHSDYFLDLVSSEILPQIVKKPVIYEGGGQERLFLGVEYVLDYIFKKVGENSSEKSSLSDYSVPTRSLSLIPSVGHLETLCAKYPQWKEHLRRWAGLQPLYLIPSPVRTVLGM